MRQIQRLLPVALRGIVPAFAALLVTGCGSGGGGGSSSTPVTPVTTATLTFVIPAAASQSKSRKPNYISPNTAAIQILIDNVNGSPTVPPGFAPSTTIQLSTKPGGHCTAATSTTGETCTVQIPAPAGNIVYTFTILDSKSNPLATVKQLLTIVKGESNNLQVVLGGIVASVTILVPTLLAGVKSTGTLIVSAYDASGALIDATAPYAVPIILTDTDKTLDTHLEVRNGIGPTAQVNTASDVVTFTYNGDPSIPPFQITATVGTTVVGSSGTIVPTTAAIAFSNTYIDTGAPGDLNYEQPTIFFATVPAPAVTTTASESGYSGTFSAVLDPATCGTGANAVTTISASPNTNFTVSPLNPGVCKVVVSDTIGHQSIFWVSVTTGVVTINGHAHRIVK